MSESIHIAIASDNRYARYAGAVMASVLKHASEEDRLIFHILDSGILPKMKQKICSLQNLHPGTECYFHAVRAEEILPKASLPSYISRTSMVRLELPNILSDLRQIIYLDCDVIVMDSLRELWTFPLEGDQVLAGAHDFGRFLEKHCSQLGLSADWYVNAGVLKMNLQKMREMDSSRLFSEALERWSALITMGDQDLLNIAFSGKIALLPQRWNIHKSVFKALSQREPSAITENVGIIHFTGEKKPWHYGAIRHPFRREYFKAVKGTVFSEPLKDFINRYLLLADRRRYKIVKAE